MATSTITRDVITTRQNDFQPQRLGYLFNKPRPAGGAAIPVDMDYMLEKPQPGGTPSIPLRLASKNNYTETNTTTDPNTGVTTTTTSKTTETTTSNQNSPLDEKKRLDAMAEFAKRGQQLFDTKFNIKRMNLELDKYNDEWKEMEAKTTSALSGRIKELWEWRAECEWRSARHQKDWTETQIVMKRLQKVLFWLQQPLEIIDSMRKLIVKHLDDYPGHPLGQILDAEYSNIQQLAARLKDYDRKLLMHADECEQIKKIIDESWSNNYLALQLDEHVATLDARSPHIMFKPEAATPRTRMHVPERAWIERNLAQLARSDEVLSHTKPLLAFCNELINDTSAKVTMGYQNALVNLQDFLHRLTARKNVLDNMLQRTYKDLDETERNIQSLRVALSDNHRPLMLAQTRKWVRHFRPEPEKVLDQPDACIQRQLDSVLEFNAKHQAPFQALVERAEVLTKEAADIYKEICNLSTNAIPAVQNAIDRCQKYPDLGRLLGNAA